ILRWLLQAGGSGGAAVPGRRGRLFHRPRPSALAGPGRTAPRRSDPTVTTLKAGVAGWPISHSLSPLLHGAWIEAAGLDARYDAFGPETPEAFDALLARGRAGELRGINVTAPYKEQAFAAADETSEAAR